VREKSAELGRAASVVDMWEELLPSGFYEHCNIAGISKGVLTIEAEAGPYMHELRVLSEELLEHIKDKCPRSGIRKIKITTRRT
jgi:predicted nucleic acid-binding Zn ribbon protein